MYDVTNTLFYRKPDCPCKGCSDRNAGCHSACEKYADWSKEEKAINDKITAAKMTETMKNEVELKGIKRKRGYKK